MASCQTSRWVSTSPYVELIVTQQSSTGTTVTLKYELMYMSEYGEANTSVNKEYSVTINGAKVKSGTCNIDGKNSFQICSGTVTIDRSTSAKNISFSCSFGFNLTWSGSYCGTKTASGSITIPGLAYYKVTYNANGGTGAPSTQTKYYGKNLTLSSTKPTRSGYSFSKWNTNASGTGTSYNSGASYTGNANLTLYAIWSAATYTVSYNANGGSGAPSSQTKTRGTALTLSSAKPTRSGYAFQGWATSSTGSVKYLPGAKYTIDEAVTLYAVWSSTYTKPKISSLSADRCNSSGNVDDSGTYALVKFNWSSSITVTSIKIRWKEELSSVTAWNEVSVTASGTSGSVSQIIGADLLDTETSYSICAVVTDNTDSTERYVSISGSIFPIDILGCGPSGKQGVSIGKPAELEEVLDVKWLARLRNHLCVGNKTGHLDGKTGVFLSHEGYMHLQRSTSQSYHPYIAFLTDDATNVSAQIRYNVTTGKMELLGSEVVIAKQLNTENKLLSTFSDCGFTHTHPTSNVTVNFGVGSGGTNRGIYDTTTGHWLFLYNGSDILLYPEAGQFRPYYKAGDSLSTSIRTAGYLTNGLTDVWFTIPLSKPTVGVSNVNISSINGLILRQMETYTHGSSADTPVKPSSYTASLSNGGFIVVKATLPAYSGAINNASIGIHASVNITFN